MTYTEITTDRLLLRKPGLQDISAIQFLRTDATVNLFVQRPKAETKEKAIAFIEKIVGMIESEYAYYWSITSIGRDEMIGSISLWNFSEDKLTAEVGYDLHPDFQKKGIMSEALEAILKFGFNSLQLNTIEAYTQHNNASSVNLLTRYGFALEPERRDEGNASNRIFTVKNPK